MLQGGRRNSPAAPRGFMRTPSAPGGGIGVDPREGVRLATVPRGSVAGRRGVGDGSGGIEEGGGIEDRRGEPELVGDGGDTDPGVVDVDLVQHIVAEGGAVPTTVLAPTRRSSDRRRDPAAARSWRSSSRYRAHRGRPTYRDRDRRRPGPWQWRGLPCGTTWSVHLLVSSGSRSTNGAHRARRRTPGPRPGWCSRPAWCQRRSRSAPPGVDHARDDVRTVQNGSVGGRRLRRCPDRTAGAGEQAHTTGGNDSCGRSSDGRSLEKVTTADAVHAVLLAIADGALGNPICLLCDDRPARPTDRHSARPVNPDAKIPRFLGSTAVRRCAGRR